MANKLTPEQIQYISERGFTVIEGEPPQQEAFPYLVLREPQKFYEQGSIEYRLLQGSKTISHGHPSGNPSDELVDVIEQAVANNIPFDGSPIWFTTTPGQPIKVFVVDPTWTQVAENLVAKHGPSG
ncbi:MAG: hypothetical protein V1735_01395 [Nanoarchaeota archaeon]